MHVPCTYHHNQDIEPNNKFFSVSLVIIVGYNRVSFHDFDIQSYCTFPITIVPKTLDNIVPKDLASSFTPSSISIPPC